MEQKLDPTKDYILVKDLSTAYEWVQKMLQYNFNALNYENISKWIKETWMIIQT